VEKQLADLSFRLVLWQFLWLLAFGLWIFCLADILRSRFAQNDKLIWVLAVILLPVLGAVLYLFIGKNKKLKQD
jgi:hypothetical protein